MTRSLRRAAVVVVAAAFAVSLLVAARTSAPSAEQRANHLNGQLRCPVCQGLSVADSHSSTSLAIAADVRRRVHAGQSDDEIRNAYVARYGEWILLNPRGGAGAVAWLLPIALVVGAGGGIGLALRRWSVSTLRTPTDADRKLVEQTRRRLAASSPEGSR